MTIAASVEAVLAADATLTAALTGGIYTYQEIKMLGLTRDNTAIASTLFDSTTKKMKPCAVVKQRSRVPTGDIKDQALQLTSEAAVIEVWLYTTANDAPPEIAADRVYALLHERQVVTGTLQWVNTIEDYRDEAMEHANVIRLDFVYSGIRS